MKFANRLKFYIFGLGIGILISYMFFGNRSCGGWLPGNRVKAAILDFEVKTSNYLTCLMENSAFKPDSLAKYVVGSSVNFNQSNTENSPRIYALSNGSLDLKFAVNFEDSSIYVIDLPVNGGQYGCDTLSKKYDIKIDSKLRKFLKKK